MVAGREGCKIPIYELNEDLVFPPAEHAEPDGLLALGGDLSVERLVLAYRSGLFPWYNEGEPVLWWSPDPRLVLRPSELTISRSLGKTLRQQRFRYSLNREFEAVVTACSEVPRPGQDGTWIQTEMIRAYTTLHEAGYAHSLEVYQDEVLVAGLYGVALGQCFFGESMFTRVDDASKCGFVCLVNFLHVQGVRMIDCQVHTEHLARFGATMVPREAFLAELKELIVDDSPCDGWKDVDSLTVEGAV